MIDKELEKYYSTYRGLFASEGWKLLLQDLVNNAQVINQIESCKDDNDMHFRKGQLSIIGNMLALEDQIKAAEEQAEQGELEDSEAA